MAFKPQRKTSDLGLVFPSGVRVGKVPYGLGVFAYAFIPQGTPLGRIQGEIIADAEYGSDYCISAGEGKVLEPGPPFCYLNHSCEPNCQLMQYVREQDENGTLEVGELSETDMNLEEEEEETDEESLDDDCFYGDGGAAELVDAAEFNDAADEEAEAEEYEMHFEDDEDSEIWVEAIRDIMPGDELTIDYAWPADRAAKCLCGSSQCRGWIVDPAELDQLQGKE